MRSQLDDHPLLCTTHYSVPVCTAHIHTVSSAAAVAARAQNHAPSTGAGAGALAGAPLAAPQQAAMEQVGNDGWVGVASTCLQRPALWSHAYPAEQSAACFIAMMHPVMLLMTAQHCTLY